MEPLDYLRIAGTHQDADASALLRTVKINLVTNFTDGVLQKILSGVALANGVYPVVRAVPYRQYHLHLKDKESALWRDAADITFILFDVNLYIPSSFTVDADHMENVLADVEEYARHQKKPVIVSTFVTPYAGPYGNLYLMHPLFSQVAGANGKIMDMASRMANVFPFEINRFVHMHGEKSARDFRGLYAYDSPFAHEFLASVAEEWFSYIQAVSGHAKKCLVLDLDNTLWGGIVGEAGPLGIQLGPDYPGSAYRAFQCALAELAGRGIILAINSKNNLADVREVFASNPHMVLKEKDFAAIRANWDSKADNIVSIAEELNIGVDSMVFLDDDPMQRDLVRRQLPDVLVPEFSLAPEEYVPLLFSLNAFTQLGITDEDRKKSVMYAEERQRKTVLASAGSIDEYIAQLGIELDIAMNNRSFVPRVSQLTQKTNQFNLTTRRYTEKEIEEFMGKDGMVFSANVKDKFGDYGVTIAALVRPESGSAVLLDSFLMSCRVMGRRVEQQFLDHITSHLAEKGIREIRADFIPTAKNDPARDFLPSAGFEMASSGENGAIGYRRLL